MQLPTQLLRRRIDAHKGDFGHIFVLAGSKNYSGAALLCAEAAIRSGAGLLTLGIPESLNSAIIKVKPKEVMTLSLPETREGTLSLAGYKKIKGFITGIDTLVIGPGLTQNKSTSALIRKLVFNLDKPTVIDADGLNALVGQLDKLKIQRAKLKPFVLTPHAGEMARLLGIGVARVQAQRKEIAKKFAKVYNLTVVLKGHHTVVADGKGKLYINKTGNPGMATGGSGDVLSGVIAAFLGQGIEPFKAAKYAVYIHGLAGDLAAEEKTQLAMIASDIIEKIPCAIKKHC